MMNPIGKLVTTAYGLRAKLARAAYSGPVAPHDAALRLKEDGVVVLEGLMPAERLAEIAAINKGRFDYENASDTVFSPDGAKIAPGNTVTREEFARYYFLHIRRYSEKLDLYKYVDPLVQPILRSYYGSHYYYRELDCYRSQPVATKFQGSYAWHRDNYPPGSIKVMVYMTDVLSEEDGPLVYALGTQRGFKPELGHYGPRIPREEVEGKHRLLPCLGRRGTVILFDNNGIHRASNPTRGYREVLNTLVLPSIRGCRPRVNGTDAAAAPSFLQKYTR